MRFPNEIRLLDVLCIAAYFHECSTLDIGNTFRFLWGRRWCSSVSSLRRCVVRIEFVQGKPNFLVPLWVLSATFDDLGIILSTVELYNTVRILFADMPLVW